MRQLVRTLELLRQDHQRAGLVTADRERRPKIAGADVVLQRISRFQL